MAGLAAGTPNLNPIVSPDLCMGLPRRGWALDRSGVEGLTAGTPAPLLRAAPAVLEDMAVAVADAVAAAYLSEAGFGLDGARGVFKV